MGEEDEDASTDSEKKDLKVKILLLKQNPTADLKNKMLERIRFILVGPFVAYRVQDDENI